VRERGRGEKREGERGQEGATGRGEGEREMRGEEKVGCSILFA